MSEILETLMRALNSPNGIGVRVTPKDLFISKVYKEKRNNPDLFSSLTVVNPSIPDEVYIVNNGNKEAHDKSP